MASALLPVWHAELISVLSGKKRGADVADAQFVAGIEADLVNFIDATVLKNLTIFFPGISPAATVGLLRDSDRSFTLRRLSRDVKQPNSLELIVLENDVARQSKPRTVTISGFPPVSGINDCKITVPAGMRVDIDLLKELISQTFLVGYDFAVDALAAFIGRHFDHVGRPFYATMRPFIRAMPTRATRRLLLTFYYKGAEYPLLDADVVRRFVDAVDSRIGKLPRESLTQFARLYTATIADENSPFRELIRTQAAVICPLQTADSAFYGPSSGVNRLMQAIYGDAVILYPVTFRDEIVLAANFHPKDADLLVPMLERAGTALGDILDQNRRGITKSLGSLRAIRDALDRDRTSRFVGAAVMALERAPDVIEIGNAAAEALGKIIGGTSKIGRRRWYDWLAGGAPARVGSSRAMETDLRPHRRTIQLRP